MERTSVGQCSGCWLDRAADPFYASALLDGGESIKAVSEYLGHSNAALTLRIYAHLMPSSQERTRTAIGAMYATAQRPV